MILFGFFFSDRIIVLGLMLGNNLSLIRTFTSKLSTDHLPLLYSINFFSSISINYTISLFITLFSSLHPNPDLGGEPGTCF